MKYLDTNLKICKGYLFFLQVSFGSVRKQTSLVELHKDRCEAACAFHRAANTVLSLSTIPPPPPAPELQRDFLPALMATPCLIQTQVHTEQPKFEVTT